MHDEIAVVEKNPSAGADALDHARLGSIDLRDLVLNRIGDGESLTFGVARTENEEVADRRELPYVEDFEIESLLVQCRFDCTFDALLNRILQCSPSM